MDYDHKRYYRWFIVGKRDGLCGIKRALHNLPRKCREAYFNGAAYGALMREKL